VKGSDSPYSRHKVRDGIKVSVRYLPTDELLIQQYRQLEEMEKQAMAYQPIWPDSVKKAIDDAEEELSKSRKLYENSIYVAMTLGFEDGEHDIEYEPLKRGFHDFSDWTQKLQFRLNEYVSLETPDAGEVPISLYRMERTFGITKDRTFLLAFPEKFNGVHLRESQVRLHLNEFGLNTGSFSIDIDTKSVGQLILKKLKTNPRG